MEFRTEFADYKDELAFLRAYLTEQGYLYYVLDAPVIPDYEYDRLNRRLEDKQLTVELTPAAKDHIIEAAYDPIYGARPLRRAIAAQVEDPAADLLLEGALCSGGTLRVVADGDCVQVRPA